MLFRRNQKKPPPAYVPPAIFIRLKPGKQISMTPVTLTRSKDDSRMYANIIATNALSGEVYFGKVPKEYQFCYLASVAIL